MGVLIHNASFARGVANGRIRALLGVMAVLFILCAILLSGCGSSSSPGGLSRNTSLSSNAISALKDAREATASVVEAYYGSEASESGGDASVSSISLDEYRRRMANDRQTIEGEASGADTDAKAYLDCSLSAMENAEETVSFYNELGSLFADFLASTPSESEGTGIESSAALMNAISDLHTSIGEIEKPANYEQLIDGFQERLETLYQAQYYIASAYADIDNIVISGSNGIEITNWYLLEQQDVIDAISDIGRRELNATLTSLDDVLSSADANGRVSLEYEAIEEISPNLYPTYDSVVNIHAIAPDNSRSITVEVELPGFTQKYQSKYGLKQGENYIAVKPATLPMSDISGLDSNWQTQLNLTITESNSGEVLAQESANVSMNDIYDFTWVDEKFGHTVKFDLLAWLRPQAIEVDQINQKAAEYLNDISEGKLKFAGYQYDDPIITLWQVAAIQKAISDSGVLYGMDGYSLSGHQQILTPDQVVQRKHGLCIESTLLLSSCLMKANMHPIIVLTPGHAQVAVESTDGSGKYFLIETTTLPYGGLDASYGATDARFYNGLLAMDADGKAWTLSGSSEEWAAFIEEMDGDELFDGDVYFIDCNLQKVLNIAGLEAYSGKSGDNRSSSASDKSQENPSSSENDTQSDSDASSSAGSSEGAASTGDSGESQSSSSIDIDTLLEEVAKMQKEQG